MHHARPLPQSIDDPGPHSQVVPNKIKLRLAPSREVNPPRIGNPNNPIPNLNLNRRHTLPSHNQKVLPPTKTNRKQPLTSPDETAETKRDETKRGGRAGRGGRTDGAS